jgi:hypothetical protein
MSDSQFFRVLIERSDGVTYSYTLRSTVITLRDGREVKIYFFALDGDRPPLDLSQYWVHEHMRSSLPLDSQIVVARALVQLLGKTPQAAAEIAGDLKASAEGLTRQQRDEVVRHIRTVLDEE